MNDQDKTAAYIGFAIKSGECALGSTAVEKTRKKIFALLLSRDAGPNTTGEVTKKAERLGIPIIVPLQKNLEDIVHKPNCKVAGILGRELGNSILNSIKDNGSYTLRGGNN